MTHLVDLTKTLDAADRARIPDFLAPMASVIAPEISYETPDAGGRDSMMRMFGVDADTLPDGEGWAGENMNDISTHCGTHVDAPLHSGRIIAGAPARTITDIGLDELFRPGMVLDMRPWAKRGQAFSVDELKAAIAAVGRNIAEGDAVLLRTGQEDYTLEDSDYFNHAGMSGDGTRFLTDQGATILGTDAGWDRPFPVMRKAFEETGNPQEIWDGHYAIKDKEAFIVQQLTNLGALPPTGFMVGFFPLKIWKASAAPARVVAFVD
ncbi:cyclase family protein [Streptomyces platensis]|uniref:Cyclase family protein n=1 Tax=Streptomyces platensis TaxID=58346 RepID=A0AAE6TNL8_STRPT|nr:cyclase family protein [Streptomyces platensis]OSY46169.1 Kynurenine formamidase [Streptomyces platensis]QEV51693.1 cyclase family protein [Streptomyces platensis]BCK72230.1 hypothetical protein Srufu_061830 [Streptomyces libani subsp. rufus]